MSCAKISNLHRYRTYKTSESRPDRFHPFIHRIVVITGESSRSSPSPPRSHMIRFIPDFHHAQKSILCTLTLTLPPNRDRQEMDLHKKLSRIGNSSALSRRRMNTFRLCPAGLTKHSKHCLFPFLPSKKTKREY
jgi:hypothetical protein